MTYGYSVLHDADARRQGAMSEPVRIRRPDARDGAAVWSLIEASSTLDGNSLYCNLLQCSHFASTCALAEQGGAVVGWVSGYVLPEAPDIYFVWQVCVSNAARGQGLGRKLIGAVLERSICANVTTLQCTITPDNAPSWGLFAAIARRLDTPMQQAEHFLRDEHFAGRHDSEYAVTLGPFERRRISRLTSSS